MTLHRRPASASRLLVLGWALTTVAATLVPATAAAAAGSATVRVHANTFAPVEVAVDPAGTVTWVVQEDGHTIVADDHRFAYRGPRGGALPSGTVVSYEAGPSQGYIDYYCEIHGGPGRAGMAGRIRVGEPARPIASGVRVIRVPADAPTVAAAVATAAPGERIELSPGEHRVDEPVVVDTDRLTIVGTGPAPTAVRLVAAARGAGYPATALRVTGSGVRIANLSIRGFRGSGIHVDGADTTRISDVVVDAARVTLDGIVAEQVTGMTLRRTVTARARRAGIRVVDCAACGALLDGVRSHGNLVGVLVEAGRGVVVRRSTISGNAAGIIATAVSPDARRAVVVSVVGNRIRANMGRTAVATARESDRSLAVGAGVWLQGVSDSNVVGNTVESNGYGVVLAGAPSTSTVVVGNRTRDNVDADLAWDGLGANVCFGGAPASAPAPTSDPPAIAELYPCDRATVGIAFPVVNARLLHRALRG